MDDKTIEWILLEQDIHIFSKYHFPDYIWIKNENYVIEKSGSHLITKRTH